LEHTLAYLDQPEEKLRDRIVSRDDYIDNLKTLIDNQCFSTIFQSSTLDITSANLLRAINTITSNLERIADFAVNIVSQTKFLTSPAVMQQYKYETLFIELVHTIRLIPAILFSADISGAMDICNAEKSLDKLYKNTFDRILSDLSEGGPPGDLVTVLNIFHYLERAGDSLQNVGEAIIFSIMGTRLKIEQYQALESSVSRASTKIAIDDIEFETIWESKSGCRIGRIHGHEGNGTPAWAIFKEGALKKIEEERKSLRLWEKVEPGLPPHVLDFRETGINGSLLMEHLDGRTFQDILLNGNHSEINDSFKTLAETLRRIWEKTRVNKPASAEYIQQLKGRLKDVFHIYPEFDYPAHRISAVKEPSFAELLDIVEKLDKVTKASFSVLIHGDFNLDNVLYYADRKKLYFIDLHRSKLSDYVQDVSVGIVSAIRLPVFDNCYRMRLNWFVKAFYSFATEFAEETGDRTFKTRLALSMVRSFISSTRFILTHDFAANIFARGVYLSKKLAAHVDHGDEFEFPEDVLTFHESYE